MGTAIAAGQGQAPARQAALWAGVPEDVGAVTVNKVCASGMKAMTIGFDSIRAGHQSIVVAGAMESMSQAPYLVKEARWGTLKAAARQPEIGTLIDGAMEAIERENPGLRDVLPKGYGRPTLDKVRLGRVVDLISDIGLGEDHQ